jgi:hypothetical protein
MKGIVPGNIGARGSEHIRQQIRMICGRGKIVKIKTLSIKGGLTSYLFALLTIFFILVPGAGFSHETFTVHPYIAEQAFQVWPNDTSHEIYQYLGTGFSPQHCSETDCNCKTSNGQDGASIKEGLIDEDYYNIHDGQCELLFIHHFYDADYPEPNGLEGQGPGAATYAQHYWNKALDLYSNPDTRARAYWYLGRVAHLLADVSVPAHVHDDAHPTYNTDSYEDYVPGHLTGNWLTSARALPALTYNTRSELFFNLAQRTQYFPSDDKNGNTSNTGDWFSGWPANPNGMRVDIFVGRPCGEISSICTIEDSNLNLIASRLMPLAIQYTSHLYKLFWFETHKATAPSIAMDKSIVNPGESITLSGSGFTPYGPIVLHFQKPDLTEYSSVQVEADASGAFSAAYVEPMGSGPGNYSWWAVDSYTGLIVDPMTYTVWQCSNGHVKIGGTESYYSTVQDTYNALNDNGSVYMHAVSFAENLNLQHNFSIKLHGGFDCAYASNPGFTTVHGSITITSGTVTLENLIIK